jgi:hypothetical protein
MNYTVKNVEHLGQSTCSASVKTYVAYCKISTQKELKVGMNNA